MAEERGAFKFSDVVQSITEKIVRRHPHVFAQLAVSGMDEIFKNRYNKLNSEQKIAVDTIDGPVMVIAGPGSGKTELLSLHIANILHRDMVTPNQILCLTFTDSGASNMRDRLKQTIGNDANRVSIYTFHSFAAKIMEEYKEYFYNANDYKVSSEAVKNQILDNIFQSLPHINPLSSHHSEFGFTYFKSVKERISLIKRAGFNANTYMDLINRDQDNLLSIQKIIDDNWPRTRLSIKELQFVTEITNQLALIHDSIYTQIYCAELNKAKDEAMENGKTEPIRKWKEKNLVQIQGSSNYLLKEVEDKNKIQAMAYIYFEYEKKMNEAGYYDFDDMIIQLANVLNSNDNLLANLAEQYQYIMIDEFQDTSDAQLNIVYSICNHVVNEGRPNICVVGDDDQSIYKFQGAEINNVSNFRTKYTNVKVITLKYNYRSTQNIIDLSHNIAELSSERLTHKYKDINKSMFANNDMLGEIKTVSFLSTDEEYLHTVNEIVKILDENKEKSIAVIARNNSSLKDISAHLNSHDINYEFIYKDNVLQMDFILNILNILKYVQSIYNNNSINRDDILIQILRAKYWNVKREVLFSISHQVKSKSTSWLQAIKDNEYTNYIYNNIMYIAEIVESKSLINTIHDIVNIQEFRNYYFDKENKYEYYKALAALRALYEAIEEYDGENILEFLQIYEKYNLPIMINVPSNTLAKVVLLTAHRAKGLEFDYVFIIDADDKIWSKNNRPNIAPVPKYLRQLLSPIEEDDNDSIRLFFVAASRARSNLFIYSVKGITRFLPNELSSDTKILEMNNDNKILAIENSIVDSQYSLDESNVLRQLLTNYQMSPTHFNNYLSENGPQYFLEVNLLRFPQPIDITGLYGSAIHSTIEYIIMEYKIKKLKPTLEQTLDNFKVRMERERYDKAEIHKFMVRGMDVLRNFYDKRLLNLIDTVNSDGDIEVNLAGDHIVYTDEGGREAHITGKLDFIYIDNTDGGVGVINVLDWKTGKTLHSWDKGLDVNEKDKALRYKYQLMFYKMLIEHSHRYSRYKVGKLGLQFVEDKDIFTLYYEHDEVEYAKFCTLVLDTYENIINLKF